MNSLATAGITLSKSSSVIALARSTAIFNAVLSLSTTLSPYKWNSYTLALSSLALPNFLINNLKLSPITGVSKFA